MDSLITFAIMAVTVLVSFSALGNATLFRKLELNPFSVIHGKQQYRVFSHALVHGSWMHLFVNMFVLYQFGRVVEHDFMVLFGTKGYLYYAMLYIGGVAVAALPSLRKHRDNPMYSAVGASGAVSAVLFSYILMYPTNLLWLFLVIPIPAFVLGILYLWYEARMENAGDNIAHDAHYWGAVFGFVVTVIFRPSLVLSFVTDIWTTVTQWL